MVTIVVLTYNSDIVKLKQTLKSIIRQKNVDFEIIISDDSSRVSQQPEVDEFLYSLSFNNYKYLRLSQNQGTVRNCINAINNANGDYIYFISPGDMIYDEFTIASFYEFSIKNNTDIVFGDGIKYKLNNSGIPELVEGVCNPMRPQLYLGKFSNTIYSKVAFILGDYILGPCYFRKTEFAKKYFSVISSFSKFTEDNTSTLVALLDGVGINYYPKTICYYETGVGISTKKSKLIDKDFSNTYRYLKETYKHSYILKLYFLQKGNNRFKLRVFLLTHPILLYTLKKLHKVPIRYLKISTYETNKLIGSFE